MLEFGKNRMNPEGEGEPGIDGGDPNVTVTQKGAFKTKKRKPGEKTKDGAMPDIFKFQRPLHTTEAEPKILVYNESRSWQGQIPMTKELDELFGDRLKFYAICIPSDSGQLRLLEGISDQNW